MKLALLENSTGRFEFFFLVSTPDRVGAIQTRHHLLRWERGVHEETTCFFAEWWSCLSTIVLTISPRFKCPCMIVPLLGSLLGPGKVSHVITAECLKHCQNKPLQ